MTAAETGGDWDAEFKPRRISKYAYGTAAAIAGAGIVVGLLSKGKSTGATPVSYTHLTLPTKRIV